MFHISLLLKVHKADNFICHIEMHLNLFILCASTKDLCRLRLGFYIQCIKILLPPTPSMKTEKCKPLQVYHGTSAGQDLEPAGEEIS